MGPRADARGNALVPMLEKADPALQWGRELTLAEIPSFWAHDRHTVFTSMGPRADARGNYRRRAAGQPDQRTSMGPRADARGNWQHTYHIQFSMTYARPRESPYGFHAATPPANSTYHAN